MQKFGCIGRHPGESFSHVAVLGRRLRDLTVYEYKPGGFSQTRPEGWLQAQSRSVVWGKGWSRIVFLAPSTYRRPSKAPQAAKNLVSDRRLERP